MAFADRFSTLKEVSHEIEKEGIEKCGLIFGKLLYEFAHAIYRDFFHL